MRLTGDSSRDSMNLGTERLFLLSSARQKKKSSLIRSLPRLLCFTEADGNTAVFGHSGTILLSSAQRRGWPRNLDTQEEFSPFLLPHI